MSCGPGAEKFRLLDAYVGWSEAAPSPHLSGLDDPAGIRLAQRDPHALGPGLWAHLLAPRLARGCGACDWYLLTPAPARVLGRQACASEWKPLWSAACDPARLVDPVALAAWGHLLAVADAGAGRIWVWGRDGAALLAEIALHDVAAIGFDACGELLAASARQLWRFAPDGAGRGQPVALPRQAGRPYVLAGDRDGSVWLVLRRRRGTLQLWRLARGSQGWQRATLADLAAAALAPTGVAVVGTGGFCLAESSRAGMGAHTCWTWYGRPASPGTVGAAPAPELWRAATLSTVALDSGIPRCRWHRVQIDADVPSGTGVAVEVASSDDPAGAPHPDDWQLLPAGAPDALVDQPPGRYLHVRIGLRGDGGQTPVLRRVRLDFPRSTSLDWLPAVYRDNPRAEDFSERFLSLFDSGIAELDAALDQFPAAFDVAGVRSELLAWLASFLDLVFDPAWEPARQRAILAALPRLYRLRGTVAGLQLAIRLVFDSEAAIEEQAFGRAWGKLGRQGSATLGAVRLFGKARARFTLGRSGLSGAPLKSYGDPDLDPVASGAWRFRVLVAPGPLVTGAALQRLVESQKPAHTLASVRVGGGGFVLGTWSALGVDSVLAPLPAPVLGAAGSVRLGRMSVLWPARRGGHSAFVLGNPVGVGVQTVLE